MASSLVNGLQVTDDDGSINTPDHSPGYFTFMADISNNTFWNESNDFNNQAPPNGFPEQMNPGVVNDSMRAVMGAVKRSWDRINASVTSINTGNAYAVTYAVPPSAYVKGEIFTFFSSATNTGPATLSIGGLTAVAIEHPDGSALIAGDIIINAPIEVLYSGSVFFLGAVSTNKYLPLAGGAMTGPLTISGATPWTNANLNPAVYMPVGGGTFTYDITVTRGAIGAPNNAAILFGNSGTHYFLFDGTNYNLAGSQLFINGGLAYNSNNFNPASYAALSGAAFSGSVSSAGNLTISGAISGASFSSSGNGTFGSLIVSSPSGSSVALINSVRSTAVLLDGSANMGFFDNAIGGYRFYTDTGGNMITHGVSFASDFSMTSDRRAKQNIEELCSTRDTVMALRPVSFEWIKSGEPSTGFIAQDVQEVIPLAVRPSLADEDSLTVSVMPIVAHLTAFVQELEHRLADVESRV
jgi:hypothetical protein